MRLASYYESINKQQESEEKTCEEKNTHNKCLSRDWRVNAALNFKLSVKSCKLHLFFKCKEMMATPSHLLSAYYASGGVSERGETLLLTKGFHCVMAVTCREEGEQASHQA